MTLTKKSHPSSTSLPRLEVPAEHEAIRQLTPPDLNGLQYTHLPDLNHKYSRTNHNEDGPIMLLPDIDEPHPFPYILSPEVRLTSSQEDLRNSGSEDDEMEIAAQYFLMEIRFSKEFLEEILPDLLQDDFRKIAKECLVNGETGGAQNTSLV